MPQIAIAALDDLRRRQSVKFKFRRDGISRDGFAALFNGQVIVYENVCRHLPLSIDYGDNRFFTGDGNQIICKTPGRFASMVAWSKSRSESGRPPR